MEIPRQVPSWAKGMTQAGADALIRSAPWQAYCQALLAYYVAVSESLDTTQETQAMVRLQASKHTLRAMIDAPYTIAGQPGPFDRLMQEVFRVRTYGAVAATPAQDAQMGPQTVAQAAETERATFGRSRPPTSHLA